MKILRGIVATTHVDGHGDRLTRESLERAAEQAERELIPVNFEHDPRLPPLGRMVKAEVLQLQDGEHALVAHSEIFEPGDLIAPMPGREMAFRRFSPGEPDVEADRSYRCADDQAILSEIAGIPGVSISRMEKKAHDCAWTKLPKINAKDNSNKLPKIDDSPSE